MVERDRTSRGVGELIKWLGWVVLIVVHLTYLREGKKLGEVNDVESVYDPQHRTIPKEVD